MVAPRYVLMLAITSLSLSGCVASLQDMHYSLVNKTRAEYAWLSNTSLSDRWNCGSDYAHGYKSGYYDAATGKACELPAVPPPCYWSTKYQCCEGQKQIQDWYRGYQCGVAAAQGSGYPAFHDIPIGPQAPVINKSGCGACYSPTDCLCENNQTSVVSEPQLPVIPHLATQTQVATAIAVPIHQVSATQSVGTGQTEIAFGLIGPAGPAQSESAARAHSGELRAQTIQPMFR